MLKSNTQREGVDNTSISEGMYGEKEDQTYKLQCEEGVAPAVGVTELTVVPICVGVIEEGRGQHEGEVVELKLRIVLADADGGLGSC